MGLDAQVGSLEEEESVLDLLVRDRQVFLSGEMGKLTDRATQPIRYMEFYNDGDEFNKTKDGKVKGIIVMFCGRKEPIYKYNKNLP